MSAAPGPNSRPAPRFESLGSSDVAICTDDGCTSPEAGGGPEQSGPVEPETVDGSSVVQGRQTE